MVNITAITSKINEAIIIDVIRYEKGYYIHKQVEKRNNSIYVRLKKRSLIDNT